MILGFVLAGMAAGNVQRYYKTEGFALAEEGNREAEDLLVQVPPRNSSEGWVGFNITLPNQAKASYEAEGLLIPDDLDPDPFMVMAAVNETGLDLLLFDHFSDQVWNVTKAYTRVYLDSEHRYGDFIFRDLDNCSKYVLLFRSLKDETVENVSRPFRLSIRETWQEPTPLIDPYLGTVLLASLPPAGLILVIVDFQLDRKKKTRMKPKPKKRSTG